MTRTLFASRMAAWRKSLLPTLTPGETKAFLQLGFVHDVLTSYLSYCPESDRDIIHSCIRAVAPDNPKLKEYFRV